MRGRDRRSAGELLRVGIAAGGLTAVPATATGAAVTAHPAWKIRHSPNATVPGGQINSISCSAAGACTGVGKNLGTSGLDVTLAERWNGKAWRLLRTPNPAANTVPITSPE